MNDQLFKSCQEKTAQTYIKMSLSYFENSIAQDIKDGKGYDLAEIAVIWATLNNICHSYDLEPVKARLEALGVDMSPFAIRKEDLQ